MDKLVKNIVGLVVATLVLGVANADTLNDKTIQKVHVNFGSGIYFTTEQVMLDPDGCGSSSLYRFKPGSAYEKEALSVLLSAQVSGKLVSFYLDGCEGAYPAVAWINSY